MKSPYEDFLKDELILRDRLALDRTSLANENTLLAYIRTSLTILIAGVSLIKFFDLGIVHIIGWVVNVFGIVIAIIGGVRYLKLRKTIYKVRKLPSKKKT